MEYYEILILCVFVGAIVYLVGYKIALSRCRADHASALFEKTREAYDRGFSDAKKYFYEDKRDADIAERKRMEETLRKENSGYTPITSETLMAFGVSRVGQLPQSVREAYGVKPEDYSLDVDTLMQRESDVGNG
jgi:hypothetical protein